MLIKWANIFVEILISPVNEDSKLVNAISVASKNKLASSFNVSAACFNESSNTALNNEDGKKGGSGKGKTGGSGGSKIDYKTVPR